MKKILLTQILIVTIFFFIWTFSFAQSNKFLNPVKNKICIQVITPAKNPITGECKEFPTPCDVPPGWQKVKSCSGSIITIEPEKSFTKPIICKEYFWYDETNLECQGPKTFCGNFMRKDLHVFEKKEDCEKGLRENPKFKEKKKEKIKKEIKEKSEILIEDLSKIVSTINFEPREVEIDGERVSFDKEKIFIKKVGERELKILVNPEKIILKEGEKIAQVEGKLSIENEKLLIGGKEIKLTPNQLIEKLKIENPLNLEIKVKLEKENPVYFVKAVEEKKILGIFSIKIQKEIEVSAQKEEIEKLKETKKPLWLFWFFKF